MTIRTAIRQKCGQRKKNPEAKIMKTFIKISVKMEKKRNILKRKIETKR